MDKDIKQAKILLDKFFDNNQDETYLNEYIQVLSKVRKAALNMINIFEENQVEAQEALEKWVGHAEMTTVWQEVADGSAESIIELKTRLKLANESLVSSERLRALARADKMDNLEIEES